MSKYLVETFYTCTFKIVHKLDELNEKKFSWQKKHKENLTGTKEAHKPDGSLIRDSKKNMKKYESWKS